MILLLHQILSYGKRRQRSWPEEEEWQKLELLQRSEEYHFRGLHLFRSVPNSPLYGAAKLIVEAVLRYQDKTVLLPEVFDDLAEVHRAAGVSDGDSPAEPAPADPK